ncbi:sigma 54-interacting transcriptional regulator [Enterobacter mori]|nr:sigma 54-interacting transcriptional regulator [Enterobacter mori]EKX7630346.1 sigma 54-interacting transcriptional regulator [Enterobacter mori]
MKLPQLRELATSLRFSPDEGRIWMGSHRAVLLQAETFSSLRKELINALGMDMARVLLSRVYYEAGQRDAEDTLKAAGPNASWHDVVRTGGMLHALQGYVLPEHSGQGMFVGDLHSDDYCGEAIWKDSLEAEMHIAKFGVGSHAVCWNAVGYCSGYLSQCAGRTILVREVECRASGAARCRIVAKPVQQWEDAADDLRFMLPEPSPLPHEHVPLSMRLDPSYMNVTPWPRPAAAQGASDSVFVGVSAAFCVLQHKIDRVAPTQATVLLLGESGVGKSLIAREVHRRSGRAKAHFVEVNCAAIPEQLVESELFGVERGAFSGASHSRPGRFEAADGGTLFLDEIGTLSMTAQGKLLRVLQNGEMERLGSNQTISANVRVIAATNEDLKQAVRDGKFREDLYFRLNVFPIVVPPLRERRDDIPLLTDALLTRFSKRHGRNPTGIAARAMQALIHHGWPGNVRELENVLERGVIMIQGDELLDIHHLSNADDTLTSPSFFGIGHMGQLATNTEIDTDPSAVSLRNEGTATSVPALAELLVQQGKGRLPEMEDALVRAAIRQAGGNITRAAGLLGISRAQMDYRHKKIDGGTTSPRAHAEWHR